MEYTYKLVKNKDNELADVIHRYPDNARIPKDPDNKDYQAYLKWLDEGNTPLPADE